MTIVHINAVEDIISYRFMELLSELDKKFKRK